MEKWNELKIKYGFTPYLQTFKQFIPAAVQTPLHITSYYAIASMYPRYPDWVHGGLPWSTNLSIPDPYYITPALIGLSTFCVSVLYSRKKDVITSFNKVPPKAFIMIGAVGGILSVPIFGHFSSVKYNLYISHGNNIIWNIRAYIGIIIIFWCQYILIFNSK